MQYLGVLRGVGTLVCDDKPMGSTHYDLDGFQVRPGSIVASGELRMSAETLSDVFGRRELFLQTEKGRLLSIRFSGRHLPSDSEAAHVDVGGDLPPPAQWKR
jgi:hypothetical protein